MITRELTYHLLAIARFGSTKPPAAIRVLLGRRWVTHATRNDGKIFVDRYELTEAGFDALYESPHFDTARMQLDAKRRAEEASP